MHFWLEIFLAWSSLQIRQRGQPPTCDHEPKDKKPQTAIRTTKNLSTNHTKDTKLTFEPQRHKGHKDGALYFLRDLRAFVVKNRESGRRRIIADTLPAGGRS